MPDHASVPGGVRFADGTVPVYHVDGARGSTSTREASVVAPGWRDARILCDPSRIAEAGLFVFETG